MKLTKKDIIKFVISIIYGILIIVIYNSVNQVWNSLIVYCDGAFIAGASLVCVAGLSLCTSLGAFDIFSFMGAKKQNVKGRVSFYDYTEMKKEQRKTKKMYWLPYFVAGAVYLVVAVIIVIVIS